MSDLFILSLHLFYDSSGPRSSRSLNTFVPRTKKQYKEIKLLIEVCNLNLESFSVGIIHFHVSISKMSELCLSFPKSKNQTFFNLLKTISNCFIT